jgi:hypothetical protein
MSYLSDEDFETAGRNFRMKLGIDDQVRLDPIDVLRKLTRIIRRMQADVA